MEIDLLVDYGLLLCGGSDKLKKLEKTNLNYTRDPEI